MGFDVSGLNPKIRLEKPLILSSNNIKTDEQRKEYNKAYDDYYTINKGIYFQNNVWFWRPLWDYVCAVCADVMSEDNMNAGGNNSGTEIPEEVTSKMARNLMIDIALGNHIRYEQEFEEKMEALPLEKCTICDGTGNRAEPPSSGPGEMPCNGCKSKGERPSFETNYHFSAKNLNVFAEFLQDSGGISIS